MGEPFLFFFLLEALGEASGDGVGELFFFFFADGEGLASGVSDGVGLAFDFFFAEAEGDSSGDAEGLGVGDFSAVDFFFVFLCGAGVGVGAKTFFNFVLNDSAAGARTATTLAAATTKTVIAMVLIRCISCAVEIAISGRALPARPYSA